MLWVGPELVQRWSGARPRSKARFIPENAPPTYPGSRFLLPHCNKEGTAVAVLTDQNFWNETSSPPLSGCIGSACSNTRGCEKSISI